MVYGTRMNQPKHYDHRSWLMTNYVTWETVTRPRLRLREAQNPENERMKKVNFSRNVLPETSVARCNCDVWFALSEKLSWRVLKGFAKIKEINKVCYLFIYLCLSIIKRRPRQTWAAISVMSSFAFVSVLNGSINITRGFVFVFLLRCVQHETFNVLVYFSVPDISSRN